MKQNIWSAAVIGLCVILTAAVLGGAYKHKYRSQNRIVVTGLGERQFTSDLIVWKGWIVEQAPAIESCRNIFAAGESPTAPCCSCSST